MTRPLPVDAGAVASLFVSRKAARQEEARTSIAILGLLVALNAAQSGDAGKLDPAKLKGDWKYVDGKTGGTDIDKTHLQGVVKIDGDKWIIPAQPGQKNS